MVDSISQQLAENARRIRERQRPNIGGAYGAGQFIHQGHHPAVGLIFVDDGVLIRDTTPSTNLYVADTNLDWRSASEKLRLDVSVPTKVVQAFLKLERAASTISGIYIPLIRLRSVGIHPISGSLNLMRVSLQLIKADLSLGATFGLDVITWDSGFWEVATQGTIYADSSRFEPGGPFNVLATSAFVTFSLFDPEDECSVSITSDVDMNFFPVSQIQPRHGVFGIFSTPFTSGPYTGIHVFIDQFTAGLRKEADLTNFRTGKLEDKIFVIGTELLS